MSDQAEREAMSRAFAKKRVVFTLPGMETLPVRRDVTFRSTSGAALLMDVYYPSSSPDQRPPLVLMPMAYPDPTARIRGFGPLTSWAQLMAASGIAAVVYGAEAPEEDVHALLQHVRAHAAALGLDTDRVGLFATSANVTVGLSAVMRDRRLRCGALLYGYTLDLDGSTSVSDMATHFGFVNACVGKSVVDLPSETSLLFVRAGRDHFSGLNASLDRVIERALARNLPVSFINHAAGAHGFDLDEQTDISRGIVEQVLAFLRLHMNVRPDVTR